MAQKLDLVMGSTHLPPKAATPARGQQPAPAAVSVVAENAKKGNTAVLQIRLPPSDAKAIRVTSAQRDESISEFVLMCVHEWQERNPGADRG